MMQANKSSLDSGAWADWVEQSWDAHIERWMETLTVGVVRGTHSSFARTAGARSADFFQPLVEAAACQGPRKVTSVNGKVRVVDARLTRAVDFRIPSIAHHPWNDNSRHAKASKPQK